MTAASRAYVCGHCSGYLDRARGIKRELTVKCISCRRMVPLEEDDPMGGWIDAAPESGTEGPTQ